MFLLILCNSVTYCFVLIAYCNLALFKTNTTFHLTFADDRSVCVCVCVYCMYVCMYGMYVCIICMYICMYVCR